ncbi:cupin domain-containing protein [Chryseobacterium rhizosphaerae]|uniref:cupin domain-containing protein n=1 Tax=Chryseobacterium rhizosphaerae TaxID=395937 RepID=UPI002359D018|nr:cupin domain-containing protein [Chryseobacterium rhizosphaerae]MDC8101038.1 cupin domain-containing protein [Chryseobacterium rhizosphaerae]
MQTTAEKELMAFLESHPIPEHLTKAERKRMYMDGRAIIEFKLTSKESNESLSITEFHLMKGNEPPRHIHEFIDETFMVHEGVINYHIGDEMITARAGDSVFVPQTVPHHFKLLSDRAVVSTLFAPGYYDHYFWFFSRPMDQKDIKPVSMSPEELTEWNNTSAVFGTVFVDAVKK